jgi:hypothetical protein
VSEEPAILQTETPSVLRGSQFAHPHSAAREGEQRLPLLRA